MKNFVVRIANVCLILMILLVYNGITADRVEADEENRQAVEEENAKIEAANAELNGETGTSYADGTYTASAQGFGGLIEVELTVEDGEITDLVIVSAANEDAAYLTMAEDIIQDILDAQSADVDTISGATFSSTGIKDAAAACIAEAEVLASE